MEKGAYTVGDYTIQLIVVEHAEAIYNHICVVSIVYRRLLTKEKQHVTSMKLYILFRDLLVHKPGLK